MVTPRFSAGRRRLRRDAGQVLFVALVVLLLVGVAASLVAASLALDTRQALAEARRVRLAAVADAAVAEALAHLSGDPGFAGRPRGEISGGTYESRVRDLGSGMVEILVAAGVSGRERHVRVVARMLPGGPRVQLWERLSPSGYGSQR